MAAVVHFIATVAISWTITASVSLPLWAIEGLGWLYYIIFLLIYAIYYKPILSLPDQSMVDDHLNGIFFFLGIKLALCEEIYSYFGLYLSIFVLSKPLRMIMHTSIKLPLLYVDLMPSHNLQRFFVFLLLCSIIEYIIELYLFPALKSADAVVHVGLVMITCGAVMWIAAHIIAAKFRGHTLLAYILYSFFQHPGYVAIFCWWVGLQLLICNPLNTVAYVWMFWRYYDKCIPYEKILQRRDVLMKVATGKNFQHGYWREREKLSQEKLTLERMEQTKPFVSPMPDVSHPYRPFLSPLESESVLHPFLSPPESDVPHPFLSPLGPDVPHPFLSPPESDVLHHFYSLFEPDVLHPLVSHTLSESCTKFIDPVNSDSSDGKHHNLQHGMIFPIPEKAIASNMLDALHACHANFVDPMEIIHYNSSGGIYHNPLHGITLHIPEGAIPHGEQLEINIGVCLCGNFTFTSGLSPVSAIVWLCSEPEVVFLKPIKVIIPHFMECRSEADAESLEMQFMKGNHKQSASEAIQFFPADGETDFTSVPNKGILYTQHFCYQCICANISTDKLKKSRFCITCAIPQSITTGSSVYFYASYFLDTCIKCVEDQLADGYFFKKPRVFKFSDGAIITGECQCLEVQKPVTLTLEPIKISHDEIDFWQLHQNGELELMEKRKMYPPSMELTFGDLSSCEEQIVTVMFRGTEEPMEEMKIIVPSSKGTISSTQTSPVQHKTVLMPRLRDVPTMRQLYQLKTVPKESSVYIIERLAPRWKDLALLMDFDPQGRHIQLIEQKCGGEGPVACCRMVLMDWLDGKSANQSSTWKDLLEILEDMKDNQLATTLRKLLSKK